MPYEFDHRQLAEEMEIFVFHEQIGAGLPIWLPNGVAIRDELENFVRELERRERYGRVVSPHIARSELYEKSGHLRHFRDNMFPPLHWPEDESAYYLKPMNCPHHHMVFSSIPRSYRELPYRIAEYGQVYRYENSGSLHGLSRVRSLCQNDAHIYLDPGEAAEEIERVIKLHEACYRALGLNHYRYRLSKHDPKEAASFEGPRAKWLEAEDILRQALRRMRLEYFEAEGEAAFYGPKIDVQMRIGQKEESVASVQLDFLSGEKFDLAFISSSGKRERPWVIHRAPLGSHERFVAMLLEFYDGRLPGWLAPVQLCILPVSVHELSEALSLEAGLLRAGIRAKVEFGAGGLAKRIRSAHKARPFAKLILGPEELRSGKFRLQFREEIVEMWKVNLVDEMKRLLPHPLAKH